MQKITKNQENAEALLRCAEQGEECPFYLNGRRLILFGWGQCDGVFLYIADESGGIVWQAVGRSRAECAEQLSAAFLAENAGKISGVQPA